MRLYGCFAAIIRKLRLSNSERTWGSAPRLLPVCRTRCPKRNMIGRGFLTRTAYPTGTPWTNLSMDILYVGEGAGMSEFWQACRQTMRAGLRTLVCIGESAFCLHPKVCADTPSGLLT